METQEPGLLMEPPPDVEKVKSLEAVEEIYTKDYPNLNKIEGGAFISKRLRTLRGEKFSLHVDG